jgi:DNA-binding GntR family transcriptional regulator
MSLLETLAAEPDSGRFVPLSKESSLSQRAYEAVRSFLMRGMIKPGERLVTRTLATELGISTTPLREALLRLASEGALDIDGRGTVFVPVPSSANYMEIRDLRAHLEGHAAEHAAKRATSADVERLEALHEAHAVAEAAHAFGRALELNEQFHFELCRVADLPVQFRIIEMLWTQCGPLLNHFYGRQASTWRPADHPHLEIVAAMRRRDGRACRKAIQRDIVAGAGPILAELRSLENMGGSTASMP